MMAFRGILSLQPALLLNYVVRRREIAWSFRGGVSMRTCLFTLTALLWAASFGHAGPVDLSKIDRTIGKEPAYRTKSPKYCLLAFGPEAKTLVRLVHDGDRLYVDRNGHGDLTEEGEQIKGEEKRPMITSATEGERIEARVWRFDVGEVREGKRKHDAFVVEIEHFEYIPQEGERRAEDNTFVTLKLEGKRQQSAYGNFSFAARPQDAPVIHFNGPLTMATRFEDQVLRRGEKGHELRTAIGTPGVGKGTFALLSTDAVPADIHPVAEVEFPAASAGAKPIRAKFTLDHRC
jgi:hypothetical protein